ncbi:GMC family oxidoreductase N-terminal domain-containing protein [Denitrificimonas sp. JX-1]|uniref:GMC family oxidoreductase N-terminal domain-containing protein n=1 Tax=Denitrificimonas halotolerans TaxID=3098930 RepID=A0ABU5GMX4_9GAMM|nr:GMC family oxidoreductase N-terminal domain-containing protein [Denitrificimonas sp. JX-1]MDY7218044.1 GMC family oxidoreductase N-terminal domain-containing protein [Denitrificimonas sp. JX-1]
MKTEYDVIVVGAGSAGCAVAYRVARESNLEVLLLEAGSADKNMMMHVPMGFAFLLKPHKNNWSYQTELEPYLNNRVIDLPRGKVLGGCSSINGMVYIRGQKEDFDRWAAEGNKGWAYADVLPYFMRSQHNEAGADAYQGTGGPLWVSEIVDEFPIHQAFIDAAVQAGHSFNAQVNGATQAGVSWFPRTIKKGKRYSSAQAFLGAGRALSNLTVLTHAQVTQVQIEQGVAVAVQAEVKGQSILFSARQEIVLSGGAINTPQLLELSGVGQQARLRALGIQVHKDLPGVGENLQDHWNSYIKQKTQGVKTYYSEGRGLALLRNIARYLLGKKGFLGDSAATIGVFYKALPQASSPDAQIHFAPAASEYDAQGNLRPIDAITISACQLRPSSRGSVHINSVAADAKPSIRLNYLATELDQQVAVAAFKKARKILLQPALQGMLQAELAPGADVQTGEQILEYIKSTGEPVHHLAGTCKMGSDAMAVVDECLRVRGIQRLRIADASIMPSLVSGNTHAACVMIAEKCADFILRSSLIELVSPTRPFGR